MDELTGLFEQERPRLRGVAYKMLGSITEADDAVQEAWLRLNRTDTSDVDNLPGWLTTVVARVCLNMLRRREEPLGVHVPDPVLGHDPENEALLADSVGLALLVVLDSLTPAERLAFVLHDLFAVPFDEIAPMVDRTPAAARQLASRARRRVRGAAPAPDPDLGRQREVVSAFFAAARDGSFEGLVAVLHPDVVLRADGGTAQARYTATITGAREVASEARGFSRFDAVFRPELVNGAAGVVFMVGDRVLAVMGFTVVDGRIAAIDVLRDPDRLALLDFK